MAPPNRPEITVDPSVLEEDFFAFQAYKTVRDALEAASAATGPGIDGEVVSMPKVTSTPNKKNAPPRKLSKRNAKSKMLVSKGKKADSPSELSSDSGGEGPPMSGGDP
jgi:hypothetical protein